MSESPLSGRIVRAWSRDAGSCSRPCGPGAVGRPPAPGPAAGPDGDAPDELEHDAPLDDEELAAAYAVADRSVPWLRVNFVSSLDGSATASGLSAGLSDSADHRVFDVLRRLCDVVVVGAGTIRREGYGPMRLDEQQVLWRRAHGLAAHPRLAVVSARLEVDPAAPVFTDAPVRPLVLTVSDAPSESRRALAAVSEVVDCGELSVDPHRMRSALAERGLAQQHCEGGPHLFGSLISAGAVDELCLTVSPLLIAGTGPRISGDAFPEFPSPFQLVQVLRSDSTLILRYLRAQPEGRRAPA